LVARATTVPAPPQFSQEIQDLPAWLDALPATECLIQRTGTVPAVQHLTQRLRKVALTRGARTLRGKDARNKLADLCRLRAQRFEARPKTRITFLHDAVRVE
tara:strand:- start:250 stop:555 length:306 start_codon:yes stop_codon:yes gene_type:complete